MGIPFAILLFFLCLLNKIILKDKYKVYNPLSLYLYTWIAILLMHNCYFEVAEYTLLTYFLVLFGSVSLCIGFWATRNIVLTIGTRKGDYDNRVYNLDYLRKMLVLLTFFEIIRVAYMFFYVYRLAGSFDLMLHNSTYVRNLYMARSGGLQSLIEFVTNIFGLLGNVIVAIYTGKKGRKRFLFTFIWFALEIIFAFVTMSKMCFILFVVVYFVSLMNNIGSIRIQKSTTRKIVPILAVLGVIFLILIGQQRNYGYYGTSVESVVFSKAIIYVTGPLEAFGKYISQYESPFNAGASSLYFVFKIISRLIGNASEIVSHGQEIIVGNDSVNVYTWFRAFYMDFSHIGVIVMPLFAGIIAGLFYGNSNNSLFRDASIAWVSAVLVMSFYSYLWSQTIYIVIIFIAFCVDKMCRKKLYTYES